MTTPAAPALPIPNATPGGAQAMPIPNASDATQAAPVPNWGGGDPAGHGWSDGGMHEHLSPGGQMFPQHPALGGTWHDGQRYHDTILVCLRRGYDGAAFVAGSIGLLLLIVLVATVSVYATARKLRPDLIAPPTDPDASALASDEPPA